MFLKIVKQILKGKSLLRTLMNLSLTEYYLRGKVLDVGGGSSPSYFKFIKNNTGAKIEGIDLKYTNHSDRPIDFESDELPYGDNAFNQVLMFNILEHIYNYNFF